MWRCRLALGGQRWHIALLFCSELIFFLLDLAVKVVDDSLSTQVCSLHFGGLDLHIVEPVGCCIQSQQLLKVDQPCLHLVSKTGNIVRYYFSVRGKEGLNPVVLTGSSVLSVRQQQLLPLSLRLCRLESSSRAYCLFISAIEEIEVAELNRCCPKIVYFSFS